MNFYTEEYRKLIVAISLQSNIIKVIYYYTLLRKTHYITQLR